MRQLLSTLCDFVFPRLCGVCAERLREGELLLCPLCAGQIEEPRLPLCPICGRENAPTSSPPPCDQCPAGEVFFDYARAASTFAGPAKVVVEKLKYSGRPEYASLMALRISRIYSRDLVLKPPDVIAPVPLFPARQRERGFNQSAAIASCLSRLVGIATAPGILKRIRATPSQTRLSRRQRRENVHGAFAAASPEQIRGRRILLVDDVYTTGSTLNECARALRLAGADGVFCLAFARARLV